MEANYLNFYNLKDDPFHLTPDTAYFYNSPAHATALLSLEYCISQKEGFCLLTGEPGTGKTTIQRIFTEKWKDRAEIALIMTPRLSADDFFRAILDDFKIPLSSCKNEMLKSFRDFLLTHAANDRRVAIIVDEAQELPDKTLEELRLLSNMETEKEKLLQIILIGQPELRLKLLGESLRQLNQRITVRVQLKPLNAHETSDYINTRLIKGGISSMLYDQNAKNLIFNLSGGIPRTINLLASRGLMSAFLDNSKIVSERHIQIAAADVLEPQTVRTKNSSAYSGDRSAAVSSGGSHGGSTLQRLANLTIGFTQKLFGNSSPTNREPQNHPVVASAGADTDNVEDWGLPKPVVTAKQMEQSPAPPALAPVSRIQDTLELEVGLGLAPMFDASQGGGFLERIRFIRHSISQKMGIDIPQVTISENKRLKEFEYSLVICGSKAGGSELTGLYLAMNSGAVIEAMQGISAKEPIFGLPAVWIKDEERETAQANGYTVVDRTTVFATHINEMIKRYSLEQVYRQENQYESE